MNNNNIIGNNMIRIVECNRCGYKWATRLDREPKCCSKCKSPYWNKERVR